MLLAGFPREGEGKAVQMVVYNLMNISLYEVAGQNEVLKPHFLSERWSVRRL
jgi:hypothetical protein